ncbi:hypothetical protein SmJEL517_g02075 [Synchytrium microbalum]|uniref:U3 small nucleolar RNA-associated protein 18 homolog n=1 Tax=Synchytrium microbalum TaxID=1806994 RepID=A0A507C8I6_9FUNG|nr:uncharacterized protein SmJEL517_g02075 [Synchytrium microbalum]TPX35459.1 hypothetical protein SmJEL517_g02075 [Synchytrium microbalum]
MTSYALPPPNPELSRKRKRKKTPASIATIDNPEVSHPEPDNEELALEALLFGGEQPGRLDTLLSKAGKELDDSLTSHRLKEDTSRHLNDDDDDEASLLFTIDTKGSSVNPALEGQENSTRIDSTSQDINVLSTSSKTAELPQQKPAWEDDDDLFVEISNKSRLRKLRKTESENVVSSAEYEARLRTQFEKINPRPRWADGVIATDNDDDDEPMFLKTSGTITEKSTGVNLSPDAISVTRLKDGNQMAFSQCVIQSVQFHPKTPVMLTAGFDKTLRLFRIDGKVNPKIQSVWFKDMPIHQASFTADGKQVVLVGGRKHFYTYDMDRGDVQKVFGIRGRTEKSFEKFVVSPCNRYIAFIGDAGYIILVSRDTKQWIANLRMNGTVKSLCFSSDGEMIYSVGSDDEIYQFETRSRQCIYKVKDISTFKTTTIALSPNGQHLATGSRSGIVNIYDTAATFSSTTNGSVVAIKTLPNLTTSIHSLQFHPSNGALLFASRAKKDALRLAHLPSLKVFPNWPTAATPLSYINSVDFSPKGGFAAMGNDKGRVLLYKLNAWESY